MVTFRNNNNNVRSNFEKKFLKIMAIDQNLPLIIQIMIVLKEKFR